MGGVLYVCAQFHLWMYNVTEDRVKEVEARLSNLESWQMKRSGLLYHLLLQKMGLFHHTGSSDIAPLARHAIRHCNSYQSTVMLINNHTPIKVYLITTWPPNYFES